MLSLDKVAQQDLLGYRKRNAATWPRKLLHKTFRPNELHMFHCTRVLIAHFYSAQTIIIFALLFSSFSLFPALNDIDRIMRVESFNRNYFQQLWHKNIEHAAVITNTTVIDFVEFMIGRQKLAFSKSGTALPNSGWRTGPRLEPEVEARPCETMAQAVLEYHVQRWP